MDRVWEVFCVFKKLIICYFNFQTGLMYWPFMQVKISKKKKVRIQKKEYSFICMCNISCCFLPSSQFLNFILMPLHMRTAFMGCCAFLWATFLCFSRQSGDGTAGVALAFVMDPRKTLEEIREARLTRKKEKAQREN